MSAAREWITDRLPTAADADEDGEVRVQNGSETEPLDGPCFHWELVVPGMAWCHTDIWEQENEPVPAPKPALAVGQRWRRRDGVMATITEHDTSNDTAFPFCAGSYWYRADGTSCTDDSDADLVELIEPAACSTCRFARAITSTADPLLQCRCNPPQIGPRGAGWPSVADTDWCGAYQRAS